MATAKSTLRLKLLVNKKTQKVLFAEAGKEFVDFLFSLLSLPLGTVVQLIPKNSMAGSLGKLYESIETLGESFFLPTQNKESILKPRVFTNYQSPLLLCNSSSDPVIQRVYVCKNLNNPNDCNYYGSTNKRHRYWAKGLNSICPDCNNNINAEVSLVAPPAPPSKVTCSEEDGFVKGVVVTYMIMDNLEVKAMSAISGITCINKLIISDFGSLEEKEVAVGVDEGLKLLKESLQSEDVLTSVFLKK